MRQFDDTELETLLERAPLMELAIKAARETAVKRLMQGAPVVGWKLVEGRRSRDWGEGAVEMMERQGLDPWERKLRSPHSMEKEHGELGVPIEVKPGKPTLAREDDPRAPYQAATAAEFDQESPE